MEITLPSINAFVWGIPVLLLILFVGIMLSVRTRFAQLRLLPLSLRNLFQSLRKTNPDQQNVSGYKALCTALAATVGTGNIAGVAGAIAIGGPGVVFWMWVCALFGMVIKLAEVTLAVHYRTKDANGNFIGGPMYIISEGLPKKLHFLSYVYCFFGVVAAFGVGNATQVNTVIDSAKDIAAMFNHDFSKMESLLTGSLIAVLVIFAFHRGSSGVGNWAERLVPFASVAYIGLAVGVLFLYRANILKAFSTIITGAISPKAVTGGIVSSIFLTLRVGASRGVFTNEAGMGTASIAHATANVNHPIEQGLMGIIEVFLDTIVICTLTALVILCSEIPIPYGSDPGITLTLDAFSSVYGNWSKILITVLASILSFATILGWGLYGARCAQYLFGERAWHYFVAAQAVCILVSVMLNTSTIWMLSELVNGLMAIPNLLALIFLLPVFLSILKEFPNTKKAYRLK